MTELPPPSDFGFHVDPAVRAENRMLGSVLGVGLAVSIALAVTIGSARSEPDDVWFQLYAAPAGSPPTALKPGVRSGPFPDVVICYAVGTLALDVLDHVRPERTYRGRCGDGDLLTTREMADRAISLLPKQSTGAP